MFENAVDLMGHKQFEIGAASQKLLDPGVYAVWADAEAYVKVDRDKADDVGETDGYLIRVNETVYVHIQSVAYLGANAAINAHKVKG